ncbi:carbon-nitrogen hydrolase family protein [Enterococcus devriesei]|uniref:carbon-nitrogen hydrolase family protein n=1 Tax=Enterococcus devriesei TaxID=319970 RepID=UPI0036D28274
MKNRFLNVGIIQQTITENPIENLKLWEEALTKLMASYHKPELVIGVETITPFYSEVIPEGPLCVYFSSLAKKYGIYLIPGTIGETFEGKLYNTAIFFNPKGEFIGKYRKMAPWYPAESHVTPGNIEDNMQIFEIPEKRTKIGIQICYDINFPEISRNQALLGAEVLVKLTMDPEELRLTNDPFHEVRAIENQAFLVCTNGVGQFLENSLYGHSMVVNPEGKRIWEASHTPTTSCITLDLDQVTRCRQYGTLFLDHYLKHVKSFNIKRLYNENVSDAPLYKDLSNPPKNTEEYQKTISQELGLIGYDNVFETNFPDAITQMQEYLNEMRSGDYEE